MRRRLRFESVTDKIRLGAKSGDYANIIPLLNQGKVIPIISNSFFVEEIFADQSEVTDQIPEVALYNDQDLTSDEQITKEWAEFIQYPMPDKHNLARVAQYHLVEQTKERVTSYLARARYINFMKDFVLRVFEDEEEYQSIIPELKLVVKEKRFSDIVAELDLPHLSNRSDTPINLLANLPLPFYITTSYYDFLERALVKVKKEPITQVCNWTGDISGIKPEHSADRQFQPTVKTPLVYHLYGLEDYPETLVLSEDDYINFLIKVISNTNALNPIVPLSLQGKLAESQLLLLGYQLNDWDFRGLFRFLLKFRKKERQMLERGLVIQLKELNRGEITNADKILDYLRDYYDQENFEVKLKRVETFIRELWNEWNADGQGNR
jgi:hypothetical protein